jgi:hypothetical protein
LLGRAALTERPLVGDALTLRHRHRIDVRYELQILWRRWERSRLAVLANALLERLPYFGHPNEALGWGLACIVHLTQLVVRVFY